jgi:hypothetical protein
MRDMLGFARCASTITGIELSANLAGAQPSPDPLIRNAAAAASEYFPGLPDYMCQEIVSRRSNVGMEALMRQTGAVTADASYERGKESYSSVALNGELANRPLEQGGGVFARGDSSHATIQLRHIR